MDDTTVQWSVSLGGPRIANLTYQVWKFLQICAGRNLILIRKDGQQLSTKFGKQAGLGQKMVGND